MSKRQKIGIFAGSFDPIHVGHVQAAQTAMEAAQLDTVYFVVEPRPRYKQGVKAFEHRSEMVRRALRNMPQFKQIVIDDPYCSTQETIPYLQHRFAGDELYLILGDDVALKIGEWSDVHTLFDAVQLIIIQRVADAQIIEGIFNRIQAISGKKARYQHVDLAVNTASSSDIKRRLKQQLVEDELHADVLSYVLEHNLYGSSGLGS